MVNGAAGEHAVSKAFMAQQWLQGFSTDLPEADTKRDDMAFWMYSSGSTGRPKGIVHLQHDMAYSEAAFARDRKSTRLNSSHALLSRMPSSA